MDILQSTFDSERFFSTLANSHRQILCLDYDGTLAPFREKRYEAEPYDGVVDSVDAIMTVNTCRVVIISGRWSKDLFKLLQLKQKPEAWCSHGWEHVRPDGTVRVHRVPEKALAALASMEDWLREEGYDGYCEPKPACLAIHWRGLPHNRMLEMKEGLQAHFYSEQYDHDLELASFDGGLELRVPGRTKGNAVNDVMLSEPEDAVAAYLGDDLTDEDAFTALAGRGLRVLVRAQPRSTSADIRLHPPDELLNFLQRWNLCCRTAAGK